VLATAIDNAIVLWPYILVYCFVLVWPSAVRKATNQMLIVAVRLYFQKPHTALCKPTTPYEQERPDTVQRIKCGGLSLVRPSVKNVCW